MADVRTNVRITADDRDLKKLQGTLGKVFDKRSARELAVTTKGLQDQFHKTTATVVRLTDQLLKVRAGTAAYKALSRELKGANEQARLLSRSLVQIEQLADRQQRKDRQRGDAGARSFVGGLVQGLGVAQYVPAEPGMGRRIAGAMVGGAARRGAGMAAAPFLTPGMGGISQAFAGIPIVGGALAGAVQTAAGAYSQAVGYDRQRWENLQYGRWRSASEMRDLRASRAARAAGIRGVGREMARGRLVDLSREELTRKVLGVGGTGAAMLPGEEGGISGGQRLPGGGVLLRGEGGPPTWTGFGGRVFEQDVAQLRERAVGIAANAPVRERGSRIIQAADERARRIQAARDSQLAMPGAGFGVPFGMGAGQVQQAFGQFMGARGGLYTPEARGQLRGAMAARINFGIGFEQAGAFGRMGIPGGGGTGGMDLSTVLQHAFVEGLNGSQVSEYLQTMVQLGQQAERTGVKFDPSAFVRSSALLNVAGLEGLQARRVTGGMQQAAMGLSARGVSGPMDVLMMRAAGFDPSQGAEGYARAMNQLAGGLSPDMLNNLLGELTTGVRGAGFGSEMQALMLRRAMGKMGVQIGPGQASKILTSYKVSGGQLPSGVAEIWAEGGREGADARMRERARRRVAEGAGLTIGAAGLEVEQISVGRQAARAVREAEKNQLQASTVALKHFGSTIDKINKSVSGAIEAFDGFANRARSWWEKVFESAPGGGGNGPRPGRPQ
jgi:hypothetical protein